MIRFLFLCLLTSCVWGQELISNQEKAIAIVSVNVIPMDKEEVLRDYTVIVRNGRITDLGPSSQLKTPSGAHVVDGKGKYLVPGWAEMHAHVPQVDDLEPMKEVLMLYLVNGITNIRGMLGVPKHLELRDKIRSGEILGPHFITSGPSLSGQSVRSPERGVEMVHEQYKAGYDFLKMHPGLTKATFPGIAAASKETGIPMAGHVSFNVGVWAVIEAGYKTIDHMDGFVEAITPGIDTMASQEAGLFGDKIAYRADRSKIPPLVEALRKNNIYVVPTQALGERWLSPHGPEAYENDPEFKYITPKVKEQWLSVKRNYVNNPNFNRERSEAFIELRRHLLKACNDGGVKLLLGSDAPQNLNVPGFSIHRELKMMVDAGLSPYDALRSGTINVAEFLGNKYSGAIRKGFDSDFVLLAGNPLEDITNTQKIEGVMIGTNFLSKSYIAAQLKKLEKN